MELDDGALPLTRGQLDIWLAQQTGLAGTEWQLGLFLRIEGGVDRDALEWALRRVLREAEPVTAAFFEVDGQFFQRVIDDPDIELAFYDLSGARDPVREARGIASSIQYTPARPRSARRKYRAADISARPPGPAPPQATNRDPVNPARPTYPTPAVNGIVARVAAVADGAGGP